MITFLANKGANLNIMTKEGETALDIACYRGLPNVVESLLKLGAVPNSNTLAHNSIEAGENAEILFQLLHSYNYRFDCVDKHGRNCT